ncbi:hypothetical protein LVD15_11925 [Fulvivirga maritima]|uniref:tetratricopeptide repeat protein n=1 Tax=Fulvivirga maritima TaxID=2904247 RepID=UPI001F2E5128|nr:hypothetical protein [Fulvivirga maritima]UII29104.1 hypothetical protein LVD15_11925 [Fulvivirga maritima]
MTIKYNRDQFFFSVFKSLDQSSSDSQIKEELTKYYSEGPFTPNIEVTPSYIKVSVDSALISKQESRYNKVVDLCEKGQYDKAKPVLDELIQEAPHISEYHRIKGQIAYDESRYEQALDSLIDALRWNPANTNALLMMGNLYVKGFNDTKTALEFYNEILTHEFNDVLTLNNIGAVLLQHNDNQGMKFIEQAYELDPKHPNTIYAIALFKFNQGELYKSFHACVELLAVVKNNSDFQKRAIKLILEIASQVNQSYKLKSLITGLIRKLELSGGKEIVRSEDSSINTAGKIEIAEYHNKEHHHIRVNSSYKNHEHLVMHELIHLDFIIQARKKKANKLFTSSIEKENIFLTDFSKELKSIEKHGIEPSRAKQFLKSLFQGMNLQAYNAPIDLFIELKLYNEYPALRPVQFASLYQLLGEGIQGVTNKQILKMAPKPIINASKIYNLVNAFQFRELYGLDLINYFKPSKNQIREAEEFYNEFKEYIDDKEAGEEYELVQNWAEDLNIHYYFTLKDENLQTKGSHPEEVISNIEKDPFGINSSNMEDETDMQKFLTYHGGDKINMAVAMYMVEAIRFFESMPQNNVKEIALEIAQIGMTGIDPNKKEYRVSLIPDKKFSGYHLLAYYYVSWAIAIPEMLSKLQMPFDKEYDLAKQFHNI